MGTAILLPTQVAVVSVADLNFEAIVVIVSV
jgi:hypothetical protein